MSPLNSQGPEPSPQSRPGIDAAPPGRLVLPRQRCPSAAVQQQQRTVVVQGLQPVEEPLGTPLEARGEQPLALAEELVDAEGDVSLRRLHHTVGEEEQRVTALQPPRD